MNVRQIRKNVTKNYLLFPLEMYTHICGSVVITAYILSEEKPDVKELRKKWKYVLRHGLGFDFSDPDYIKKVCDLFGVKMFPLDQAAFVQSEYNALICPYLEIEEGKKSILPLREDGLFARTLRVGKIYPLSDKVEKVV
jgi:hypothetical protein